MIRQRSNRSSLKLIIHRVLSILNSLGGAVTDKNRISNFSVNYREAMKYSYCARSSSSLLSLEEWLANNNWKKMRNFVLRAGLSRNASAKQVFVNLSFADRWSPRKLSFSTLNYFYGERERELNKRNETNVNRLIKLNQISVHPGIVLFSSEDVSCHCFSLLWAHGEYLTMIRSVSLANLPVTVDICHSPNGLVCLDFASVLNSSSECSIEALSS